MSDGGQPRVVVLAGGFGGAKLSHGLALTSAAGATPHELDVIVNTGDDLELHGLAVSPDLDTVMYTLAGLANDESGWGVRDETWSSGAMLERYGAQTWFGLGDRDLATHIRRTELRRGGATLTEATAELCRRLGVPARLLPMTDDEVRTQIRTPDGWLEFQEYFVKRGQQDEVLEIPSSRIEEARPTAEVLEAVADADLILIAPSNPFVSVGTILAVPGMLAALRDARASIVAVSPVVGGAALRGPADKMLRSLGGTASAAGVVVHYREHYPGLVDAFVLDEVDADEVPALEAAGAPIELLPTVMRTHDDRQALAQAILDTHLRS